MSLTQAQIDAACNWWAEHIQNVNHDNGDGLQSVFMAILASRHPRPTDEQLATFRAVLAAELSVEFRAPYDAVLSCDYHPCPELATAVAAAGIDESQVPIKTNLYFYPNGRVSARHGYRAEEVTILEASLP